MEYQNNRSRQKEEARSCKHPNSLENFEWTQEMLERIEWLPNQEACHASYVIYDCVIKQWFDFDSGEYRTKKTYPDPTHIVFSWQEFDKPATRPISFHQSSLTTNNNLGYRDQFRDTIKHLERLRFIKQKQIQQKITNSYQEPEQKNFIEDSWK